MKVTDISPEIMERIKTLRYDRIIEKHEGPESWKSKFEYGDPEIMTVEGRHILLPRDKDHHPNITILRMIVSQDEQVLTIFLKDTTHAKYYDSDPHWEMFSAGYMAVCEKMSGTELYIAIVYHEWFIVENPALN